MKISVNITFTDQSSEEELVSDGVTPQELCTLYTRVFEKLVNATKSEGVESELLVSVSDNTKEDTQ